MRVSSPPPPCPALVLPWCLPTAASGLDYFVRRQDRSFVWVILRPCVAAGPVRSARPRGGVTGCESVSTR